MEASCKTCKFFRKEEESTRGEMAGVCLRYPPQLIVGSEVVNDKLVEGVVSAFPLVDGDETWCGEFLE